MDANDNNHDEDEKKLRQGKNFSLNERGNGHNLLLSFTRDVVVSFMELLG